MKTFKILFTALIIAGFATTAMAQVQSSVSAEAEAKARVIAELNITKDADINWGDVGQDSSPNLNPVDGTVDAAGLNDSQTTFGKFTVDGTEDASIIITYDHNDLEGPGDEIIWVPALSYLAGIGADPEAEPPVAGNDDAEFGGATVTDGGDVILGDGGIGMVFVGGSLTIAENQMPGTYTGDITVTVEYN